MRPKDWDPSPGIRLEPNALTACTSTGSVAVTAGPGAGKTELLAQRADYLLRTGLCPYPRRILAISFKVDAAANLAARVRERVPRALARRLDSWTFHSFSLRLIRNFRPVLSGVDALDQDFEIGSQRLERRQITFQDFVPLARSVLESSDEVRRGLRQTYSHVFLDEFQDCTANQYQLIREAFEGSSTVLTAVGDTKQRIMSWAGALEGVFEEFAEDFGATPFNLYQNYRSEPALRRMQNRMIAVMEPAAALDPADLHGTNGQIEYLEASDADAEADQLVSWIQELLSEGVPKSEIAILVRQQSDLYTTQLRAALDQAGIAHRDDQALQDLTREPLVRLVLDFFQLLVSRRRPHPYLRLVRGDLFATDDERQLYRRRTEWDEHVTTARATLAAEDYGLADSAVLAELAQGALTFFGRASIASLHPDYESPVRVETLVDAVVDRVAALASATPDPTEALDRFADDDAVHIMTIHKSKGLEFEAVAVLGVEREMYWSKDRDAMRAEFFVAISRAKSRLLLTTAQERSRPAPGKRWDVQRHSDAEFLDYAKDD